MYDINQILKLGRKSKNKRIEKLVNWYIRHYFCCDISCNAKIADTVCFGHGALGVVISDAAIIEENTFIQHRVTIGTIGEEAPHIGKNVFIGAGAIILGGITIGNNVKIGAGAVVITDIPDNCTVVGNPAKVIKRQ